MFSKNPDNIYRLEDEGNAFDMKAEIGVVSQETPLLGGVRPYFRQIAFFRHISPLEKQKNDLLEEIATIQKLIESKQQEIDQHSISSTNSRTEKIKELTAKYNSVEGDIAKLNQSMSNSMMKPMAMMMLPHKLKEKQNIEKTLQEYQPLNKTEKIIADLRVQLETEKNNTMQPLSTAEDAKNIRLMEELISEIKDLETSNSKLATFSEKDKIKAVTLTEELQYFTSALAIRENELSLIETAIFSLNLQKTDETANQKRSLSDGEEQIDYKIRRT